MSLLYEPTYSISSLRRSTMLPSSSSSSKINQTTTTTPSSDPLPSITINFDSLQKHMSKFTLKFDTFITSRRAHLLAERNEFRSRIAETNEDQKLKTRALETLAAQRASHKTSLAREAAETTDLLTSIDSLTTHQNSTLQTRDTLLANITATQTAITQRLHTQRTHADNMANQARFNLPELDFWTDYLGMRIEGVSASASASGTGSKSKKDSIKFIFIYVSPSEWDAEASFELELGDEYAVDEATCIPRLARGVLGALVGRLNEDRDLGAFLRAVRRGFVEGLKG